MGLLNTLTTDDSIENERDTLGGSRFDPVPSGIYDTTVTLAYLNKSEGGALALNLTLEAEDGREIRQTLWMASGDAKGNRNFYLDKNREKQYLPGFILANSLALLTLGKDISALETEAKVISLYNFEARQEVPTKVEMVTPLIGQRVWSALLHQTVDRNVKDDTGAYVPSGETREENELAKFFRHKDRLTTAEIRAKATTAAFFGSWKEEWSGKTRNRAKGSGAGSGTGTGTNAANQGGAAPAPGQAQTPGGKPAESLFAS